jgi:hypothetical protein
MAPTSSCPICRILAAAQEQQLAVALHLLDAAITVRCGCPQTPHTPLVAHPHARPSCVGYATRGMTQEVTV